MSTKTNDTNQQVEETENGFNKSTRKNIHCIDPRRIKVNPNNKRDIDVESDYMQELIRSIAANGVQVAIKVTQNPDFGQITREFPDGDPYEYVVYAGNCRLSAVKYLIEKGMDFKTIDTTVEKKVSLEEQLLMQLVENKNQPFSALEKANVIRELIEVCGWKPKQVSERSGEDPVSISNMLAITKMPQKLKNLIEANAINDKLALQIVRESKTETELTEKIEALSNQAQAIEASGVKKTKRALITQKNAGDLVVKKNPLKVLETVAAQFEDEGVQGEGITMLNKLVTLLQKQDTDTNKKVKALFNFDLTK
ncbi:unnamed protein product [Sphagnum balticum]